MGFRTPEEITRELEAFDNRREAEGRGKRQKSDWEKKENLEPAPLLERFFAFVLDLAFFSAALFLPGLLFNLIVFRLIEMNLPEGVGSFQQLQQMSPEEQQAFQQSLTPEQQQAFLEAMMNVFWISFTAWAIFSTAAILAYYAIPYRIYGASLGKLCLGLTVRETDDFKNIGVIRTFFREIIGKILSSFFLLGYIMILLNHERAALHDYFAGTRVFKKYKL